MNKHYAHQEMREAYGSYELVPLRLLVLRNLTNNIVEFELYDIHTDI